MLYDLEVSRLMHEAKSDADAAADLLLLTADYLRKASGLPNGMGWFLADAFEVSMRLPPGKREAALLQALLLKTAGRRPVRTPWLNNPGEALQDLIDGGASQNAAASQVAVDFEISEATAVRLWRDWVCAKKAYDELNAAEDAMQTGDDW